MSAQPDTRLSMKEPMWPSMTATGARMKAIRRGDGDAFGVENREVAHRYEEIGSKRRENGDVRGERTAAVGHRIPGDRTTRVRGIGREFAHIAVDDRSCLTSVEMLPDERKESSTVFLLRAPTAAGCRRLDTRPYTPKTSGVVERFLRTLKEQQIVYGRIYSKPQGDARRGQGALRGLQRGLDHGEERLRRTAQTRRN